MSVMIFRIETIGKRIIIVVAICRTKSNKTINQTATDAPWDSELTQAKEK